MGCREQASQAELVRFAAVDGVLTEGRQLPGRGAYLHPQRECLEAAVRRRAFARALRTQVTIPIDFENEWPRSA